MLVGNRGTVDAYGVPLWVAFGEELRWSRPVRREPAAGAARTDRDGLVTDRDRRRQPPSPSSPRIADSFHFLLPIVPAGSSSAFRIRVKSPPFVEPAPAGSIHVATNIGDPYFQPDLSAEVVAFYVSQAKEYAVRAHGTTTFPADAAIEAYVRTQLAAVVADGRLAAVGNDERQSSRSTARPSSSSTRASSSQARAQRPRRRPRSRVARAHRRGARRRLGRGPCSSDPDCDPQARRPTASATAKRSRDPLPQVLSRSREPCASSRLRPSSGATRLNHQISRRVQTPNPCKPRPRPTTDVPFRGSHDPNDKAGPGGPGGFIDGVTPLRYTVTFENVATATGDAFEVTVTDQLDVAKYDLDTFSLGPISFADKFVPVPPGLKSFSTEVDMRPGVNILVGIDAALDTATGIVTWKFTTLDPATHEFPEDPEDGFLPPNVTSPEGEGEMLFTVSLKPGFGLGTTVCNDASIVFDFNPPIVTNELLQHDRRARGPARGSRRPCERPSAVPWSRVAARDELRKLPRRRRRRADRLRGPELLQRERAGVEPAARAHEAGEGHERAPPQRSAGRYDP